nr:transmembrane protein 241 isoform X3 [Manis javanica]
MCVRTYLVGFTFCTCYLASYLTNKEEEADLGFGTVGWTRSRSGDARSRMKISGESWEEHTEILCPLCLEIYLPNIIPRVADINWWPFASCVVETGLDRDQQQLKVIPVFLTLHNVAEVIICGHQKCFQKEKTSPAKICSALLLLAAAGCLPFNDPQFDPDGYFWAVIHVFCVGAYKILQKSQKPNALSDIDQQYLNYIFSVVLLAFASHPTGDLLSVLDFPFLYFYRFHGSCCASGFLGFFLMFSTVKLKSLMAPGQCAAWIFFAKESTQEKWKLISTKSLKT